MTAERGVAELMSLSLIAFFSILIFGTGSGFSGGSFAMASCISSSVGIGCLRRSRSAFVSSSIGAAGETCCCASATTDVAFAEPAWVASTPASFADSPIPASFASFLDRATSFSTPGSLGCAAMNALSAGSFSAAVRPSSEAENMSIASFTSADGVFVAAALPASFPGSSLLALDASFFDSPAAFTMSSNGSHSPPFAETETAYGILVFPLLP